MKNRVNNIPEYAYDYPAWVCSVVDGALWFYGAYRTSEEAYKVAIELGKLVVES